jgi:hypothetical protein
MDSLKSFDQINFVGALLLYQRKRDSALGLVHVTSAQRGLLWYYNLLNRQRVVAQIYGPVIKAILGVAEKATDEQEAAALLKQAEAIEEKVKLGVIWQTSAA